MEEGAEKESNMEEKQRHTWAFHGSSMVGDWLSVPLGGSLKKIFQMPDYHLEKRSSVDQER